MKITAQQDLKYDKSSVKENFDVALNKNKIQKNLYKVFQQQQLTSEGF